MRIEQFVPNMANLSLEESFVKRRQGFENFIARSVKNQGYDVSLYYLTGLSTKEKRLTHLDGYDLH